MTKIWTQEKIKEGFEKFLEENNRLPTALEIDKLDYLPSSRNIQKRFGGLEKIRSNLGFKDVHFGKGRFRSEIAFRVNKRGRDVEIALEKILRKKFGEPFVHTEKIFDNSKNRVDFYIYSPDGNFGIDVFYTDNLHYLQSNINIKTKKYLNFPSQLFLVVANRSLSQNELDKYSASKIKKLSDNIKIMALDDFLMILGSKKFYPNPIN